MSHAYAEWVAERDRAVWSAYGIASLAATHWLTDAEAAFPDVAGRWRADGGAVVGTQLPGGDVVLAPGEAIDIDALRLRAFARDGALAVRVLDPRAAERRGIRAIERFAYDPELRVAGRFHPAAQTIARMSVDHHASATVFDGIVSFTLQGQEVHLIVEEDDGALFAVFADATAGSESYPFRFVRISAPDPGVEVVIDLNLAFLPPCAFSDHYVCVLPPPGNRLSVPVRAGERGVR